MMDIKHETKKHLNQKRRTALMTLSALFMLIGSAWLIYWLIWGRFEEYTDDAYVNGNVVEVMPQIPGTVIEIDTDDTQLVKQGEVVVKLDPTNMEIALERAKSSLAETVRQVRQYFENTERAETILIMRGADLLKAQLDLKRRTGLVGEKAISREEMQHYLTAEKTAQAQYNYALHNLRASLALVENSHVYTHPLVERAKSNLKNAFLNRQRTTILAPVTGYVAKRNVQLGQQVSKKSAMLAIIPLDQIWVDANYKESQLSNIRIDQPVTLHADAYPGMTYHGKILGFTPGTGVSFSLLPPQNATGNWIKIVQRLPVRVKLDVDELNKNPLFLGLSMRVTTNTYHRNGKRLARSSVSRPLYTTTVYNNQLAQVDSIINHILENNSPDLFIPISHFDVGPQNG